MKKRAAPVHPADVPAPMPEFLIRAKRDDEPDSYQYSSGLLKKWVNLTVSLQSVQDLKRIAEELRGVATRMEQLAHFQGDAKPEVVLWQVQSLVMQTNARLARIKRRGRPPKQKPRAPYGRKI